MVIADAEVGRALVVVAHPDDIDFGAGGTVAAWADAGIEVTELLVTRGDAGGFDDTPRSAMPELRETEQRAAAAELGVSDVRFLDGYADGLVSPSQSLVRDIVRVIRQVRPTRILTSSPERWWERLGASHPDHLATGEATVRAIYPAARNPFAFPELLADEGLDAWTVAELWLMADPQSDHPVDTTATFARKMAALEAHVSQTGHEADLEDRLRSWSAAVAARHGLPDGRLAEAFRVIALPP
ncbi:MAG: PIG-L deacetylase family protein [Actinomycetales bacterium]